MKKLIALAAMTVICTPAFAASHDANFGGQLNLSCSATVDQAGLNDGSLTNLAELSYAGPVQGQMSGGLWESPLSDFAKLTSTCPVAVSFKFGDNYTAGMRLLDASNAATDVNDTTVVFGAAVIPDLTVDVGGSDAFYGYLAPGDTSISPVCSEVSVGGGASICESFASGLILPAELGTTLQAKFQAKINATVPSGKYVVGLVATFTEQ